MPTAPHASFCLLCSILVPLSAWVSGFLVGVAICRSIFLPNTSAKADRFREREASVYDQVKTSAKNLNEETIRNMVNAAEERKRKQRTNHKETMNNKDNR